jgi:hypothetical protein
MAQMLPCTIAAGLYGQSGGPQCYEQEPMIEQISVPVSPATKAHL